MEIFPTREERKVLEDFEQQRKTEIIPMYSAEWHYRAQIKNKYYRKPFWLLRLRCYFFKHSFTELFWNKQLYRQCEHCGLLDF